MPQLNQRMSFCFYMTSNETGRCLRASSGTRNFSTVVNLSSVQHVQLNFGWDWVVLTALLKCQVLLQLIQVLMRYTLAMSTSRLATQTSRCTEKP